MKYSLHKTIDNESFGRLLRTRKGNLSVITQEIIHCDLWCLLKEQLDLDLIPDAIYMELF